MAIRILSVVFSSAIILILALTVSVSVNVKRYTKTIFSLICTSLALWQVALLLADVSQSNLRLLNNLIFIWPSVAVFCSYLFIKDISNDQSSTLKSSKRKLLYNVQFYSFIVQICLAVSMQLITDAKRYSSTLDAELVLSRGGAYYLYIVLILICGFLVIYSLLDGMKRSAKKSRMYKAMRIVLITNILVLVSGSVTNAILPLVTNNQNLSGLGVIGTIIFAVGLFLSIAKHRFMDIRPVVVRTLVYLLSLVSIAAIYALFIYVASEYIVDVNLNGTNLPIFLLFLIISLLTYPSIKSLFDKITKKLFFRDSYNPQDLLNEINTVLVNNINLDEITSGVINVLTEKVGISKVSFSIKNSSYSSILLGASVISKADDYIISNNLKLLNSVNLETDAKTRNELLDKDVAIYVPLNDHREKFGYMLVGPKKSGRGYGTEDQKVISIIADELAIALQNALRFEEIANFNVTLQKTVEDRTRELKRSNDKLQALDTAKDEFISMASHQLRTPLTSVKGYVSMVLEGDAGPISDQQRQLLQQAFVSSQRMVYLIADLLNVSRLRTGKFIIEAKPTYLPDVVQSELDQLSDTAKARGLELVFNKPAKFPLLMLDETKIRQVIMNFTDNAIYYTPTGGRIEIVLLESPRAIELTVNDNGIGVPKKEQHHMFTKFYRAGNAKKARPDGTGLGLFMAKKVIVSQGGAVIFRSTEGKGSTFGFTFPKDKLKVGSPPYT